MSDALDDAVGRMSCCRLWKCGPHNHFIPQFRAQRRGKRQRRFETRKAFGSGQEGARHTVSGTEEVGGQTFALRRSCTARSFRCTGFPWTRCSLFLFLSLSVFSLSPSIFLSFLRAPPRSLSSQARVHAVFRSLSSCFCGARVGPRRLAWAKVGVLTGFTHLFFSPS